MGYYALRYNTTGSSNSAMGLEALRINTTGTSNSAMGVNALYSNTTGSNNSVIGRNALFSNTTGSNNSVMGVNALFYNTTATSFTAVGFEAGKGTANYNNQGGVYVGYQAGELAQTGSDYNTFLGYQAGYSNTTGAYNIALGQNVDVPSVTGSQQLNIGNLLYGTGIYNGATVSSAPVSAGLFGIGSTTPFSKLSVSGDTWLDSMNIRFASSSAPSLTLQYLKAATSTIVDNTKYAWTIATSTTAAPIFEITTNTGNKATTTITGGFVLDDGAFEYDYSSNITTIGNLSTGALNFEDDAGVVSWTDLNVTTSAVSGVPQSYTAHLDGHPMLTIYGLAGGGGELTNLAVGIGPPPPLPQLDILPGSPTPLTTGKTANYFGLNIDNQATSSTASILKAGLAISSTGSWSGTSAANIGLYVSSVTGGTNNYDAIFNGGGNVGIGTTSPYARLALVDNTASLRDVFAISTSTASGLIFKVDSYGSTYADGAYSGAGADYAEYFYTTDTDLKAGEIVCVDLLENNAVKRCRRGHDNNVMGIISNRPSIVGNNSAAVRNDPARYVIVGMLGQVDALVSTENGAIKVGDSLTSASSAPGYAMKADGGDSTVGVALEPLQAGLGKIKVLISRRNKSLAVEEVEALVVERIANMKIEDQVQAMIKQAVLNLNLDPKIGQIAREEAGKLDALLSVSINDVNGQISLLQDKIFNFQTIFNDQMTAMNNEMLSLRSASLRYDNFIASTTAVAENIRIDENGNLVIGKTSPQPSPSQGEGADADVPLLTKEGLGEVNEPRVQIIDPTEITASSSRAAFVVNQTGQGDVADFQKSGVSIMNIADSGQVKIMGSLLVDGRVMLCSGGYCSNALDAAVDETRADLGVEGKIVAGAFEGYCDDGYIWAPGSAKYGTLPGFCVMNDLMKTPSNFPLSGGGQAGFTSLTRGDEGGLNAWTNVSQGEAQIACQNLGTGYHLIGENEWLTLADNILQVAENDIDKEAAGMQLATSSPVDIGANGHSPLQYQLTNDNIIYNLSGAIAQWTNQNVTAAGLPVTADKDAWSEYSEVMDYQGLNLATDYYLTDAANNIGKIYVGSTPGLKGFARGQGGIYGLDLSHSPAEKSKNIGFRCAK